MESLKVLTRILILGSSLNILAAHPLTARFEPNAGHRVELPSLPQDFEYDIKLMPTQQYPFSMYHGLHNDDTLPPDVELVPMDSAASSSVDKEQLYFVPAEDYSESAPYMEYMVKVPIPCNRVHRKPHLHLHHHHLGGHRPMRPMYPTRPSRPLRPVCPPCPKPTTPSPPVWTIPPDVHVFPPVKPSTSQPRPFGPAHTPRPWYPPAIPSYDYSRSAPHTNETSQRSYDNKHLHENFDFSRSALDYDNDTESQTLTDVEYASLQEKSQTEQVYQLPTFDVLEIPPDYFFDERWEWLRSPDQLPSPSNPELEKNLATALLHYFEKSTTTQEPSGQMKPDSSEQGFSLENSSDTMMSLDENSTEVEEPTSGAEDGVGPVNIDLSMIDLSNMEAVLPEVGQPTAVQNADDVFATAFDNVTQSAVAHRAYEMEEVNNMELQIADWIAEDIARRELTSGAIVPGEDIVGEDELGQLQNTGIRSL